jgi:hypothetical protein
MCHCRSLRPVRESPDCLRKHLWGFLGLLSALTFRDLTGSHAAFDLLDPYGEQMVAGVESLCRRTSCLFAYRQRSVSRRSFYELSSHAPLQATENL